VPKFTPWLALEGLVIPNDDSLTGMPKLEIGKVIWPNDLRWNPFGGRRVGAGPRRYAHGVRCAPGYLLLRPVGLSCCAVRGYSDCASDVDIVAVRTM